MNTFTDTRDGNTYKTVKIGNQIWMAENLHYRGPTKKFNDWIIEEKEFYLPPNGQQKNISKYGCLYTWDNALKAVPEGWHLPQLKEFDKLLKYSGSIRVEQFKALAALEWNGDNSLDFKAVPSGGYYGSYYHYFGSEAIFWLTTEVKTNIAQNLYQTGAAYYGHLGSGYADINIGRKDYAFSVRCVKD